MAADSTIFQLTKNILIVQTKQMRLFSPRKGLTLFFTSINENITHKRFFLKFLNFNSKTEWKRMESRQEFYPLVEITSCHMQYSHWSSLCFALKQERHNLKLYPGLMAYPRIMEHIKVYKGKSTPFFYKVDNYNMYV